MSTTSSAFVTTYLTRIEVLRMLKVGLLVGLLSGHLPAIAPQASTIVGTKHNLGVTGPGPFKAQSESRICVFCHAPHRARTVAPLWNREDSRSTYLTYQSSTFKGTVSQPNGSSKLCLSCHDGTIALGSVVSLGSEITMAAGRRFLDSGESFIGTNLEDDHPVSFHYQTSKGGSGIDYLAASAIKAPVRLDHNGFVQCTSCHDAHDNSIGSFLRTTDRNSGVCLACHDPRDWNTASHSLSTAGWNNTGLDPWPAARYDNVADNACANCHRPHSAGQHARLLNFQTDEENCLRCHNGNVASKDVTPDLNKAYAHDPFLTNGIHDPIEDPLSMGRHAECQDCHNPHTAKSGTAAPPNVPGPIFAVSGLDNSATRVERIRFGYELCYKCHADKHGAKTYVPRVILQANTRFEFNPANPSYHPVEAPGRNSDVPSLIPPWTTASHVACTDCHESDTSPNFDGVGLAGPHGSIYEPLLGANYDTRDNIQESPATYALCYKCHSRASILNNESFKEHNKHVVKEKAACSACHDAHGISSTQGTQLNNSHLINFDTRVVSPSTSLGKLQFVDQGVRKGSCTLLCHGKDHKNKSY